MAKQKVIQTFSSGWSGDIDPIVLDLSAVKESRNFLFERGIMISRPGVKSVASSNITGTKYIDSIMTPSQIGLAQGPNIISTHDSATDGGVHLWRMTGMQANNTVIESPGEIALTLPAGTHLGCFYAQAVVFNQKTYVWSLRDAGGIGVCILEIDNNTNAVAHYAVPPPQPGGNLRRFSNVIITHLSRLFLIDNGVYPNPATVYWSKIGDGTVWTGHFTAGNTILQEASDGVVAGGVAKNTIVLGRPSGFHLGVPTGDASNPYDWKAVSHAGVGVGHPLSFVTYGDTIFFADSHDIYMYDLASLESIGEGVSNTIFQLCAYYGLTLRAYIVNGYKYGRRPQLHLLPTMSPSTYVDGGSTPTLPTVNPKDIPHFVYDLNEKKWSQHKYDEADNDPYPLDGWPQYYHSLHLLSTYQPVNMHRPGLIRRKSAGAQYLIWDNVAAPLGCESVMYFTTGTIDCGDPSAEFRLVRFMFHGRVSSDTTCTVQVNYSLKDVLTTTSFTFSITHSGFFKRIWVNHVIIGNLFDFTFTFPASREVQIKQVIFEVEVPGEEVRTAG